MTNYTINLIGAILIGVLILTTILYVDINIQPQPPTIIDTEPVIEPKPQPKPIKPPFTGYKVISVDTEDLEIPIHTHTYYIPLNLAPLTDGVEVSPTQRIKWADIIEHVSITQSTTDPDTPSLVGDRFNNRIFVRVNLYELESVKHQIIQQINEANKVYNNEITQIQSPEYQKHYEYAKTIQFN